ncbi:YgjV family protein [Clostridium sp. D2Q-11]|uniref:YgjV family protein n=1 Tax=Anaeromonas frigoriresistens TaxID=2683708 RepID=A0A942Z7Z0_9FIRM|nr:YgjV family protein [Anaeromonas frigoriresistens]MBS4537414.1 YgjV family protein [Anaeromonas frigoriresistens]
MDINWLEWLGYIASFIVLVSLLMSSVIKLRWINLLGSSIFALYGFLIGALPVAVMNLGIVVINIYYLFKMYKSKDYFKILPIDMDSKYFNYFLDFYKEDILTYFSKSKFDIKDSIISIYVLRNMVPAGVFIATEYDSNTLKIELDYVISEYRDFKIGNYIFESEKNYFLDKGYNRFISLSLNNKHDRYLEKMGFTKITEDGNDYFVKEIN